MIGQAIDVHALRVLVGNHQVRDAYVGKQAGSDQHWVLSIRLSAAGRLIPIRSKREPVRTWKSLSSVGKFAEGVGLKGLIVEL